MVVRGKSSICRAQLAWVLALYFALFSGRASLADETDLMDQATALYEGVATSEPVLRQIRGLLDRIVADYPESDLALRILLQEEIGALDVAEINARLADARPNPQPIQSGSEANPEAIAAEPWADALDRAAIAFKDAAVLEGEARLAAFRDVRRVLDSIVADYPDSDIAMRILLQEDVAGISLSALAEANATEQAVVPQSGASTRVDSEVPAITPATEASQQALALDEAAIRDLQSRLLVLGFDPNGVDGSIGNGTRSAVSAWQESAGLPVTGFLDSAQLASLKAGSQAALEIWLVTPENRKLHDPPPPIELSRGALSGQWSFVATCGKKSRFPGQQIKGALDIRFGNGDGFDGTARNSQGFNGTVRGELDGRTISGRISWGLLVGSVDFSGRIADHSLTINGRDSNGCRLTALKG